MSIKNVTLITCAGILAVLAAVMVIRTACFASRQIEAAPAERYQIDKTAVAKRLSEAIQHRTVSYREPGEPAVTEFDRFHRFLTAAFPAVHSRLAKEVIGGHALLYTWEGHDSSLKPILLMGHTDVVPAESGAERRWTHPPFSGRVADGYVWGRGTMDDKVTVLGVLEAVEHLLSRGFRPRRTIYLAFGHDEETGGSRGAALIAEVLRARHVELDFVLDEGANIVVGILPGIFEPVALIGISEKGYVNLELAVEAAGGHASIPPPLTAIGILAEAVAKLERSPLPTRLDGVTRTMFEFVGPEMPWSARLLLANLWLFDPLVRFRLAQSPLTNAVVRSTHALTVLEAGATENVLPGRARAVVNVRILPGDTTAGMIDHVHKVINDSRVSVKLLGIASEPSPVADVESSAFKLLHRTIEEVAPEVLVAPSLVVAATDARHYAGLTPNIFRFLPITLRADDAGRYHGIDERISLADYERCVRFYVQLISNSAAP